MLPAFEQKENEVPVFRFTMENGETGKGVVELHATTYLLRNAGVCSKCIKECTKNRHYFHNHGFVREGQMLGELEPGWCKETQKAMSHESSGYSALVELYPVHWLKRPRVITYGLFLEWIETEVAIEAGKYEATLCKENGH